MGFSMQEVMAEIFTLIAYLAIALMAVTVPTYAIAISYLARETSRSIEDMNKRRRLLSRRLDRLRSGLEEKLGVEAIEGEITKYKEEEAGLKNRLRCLSAKGAVGYPFASFMVALAFASYNIYADIVDPTILLLLTVPIIGGMSFGIYRLGKTLVAIERAALRPEEKILPSFRVAFMSGSSFETFKIGEEKAVRFAVDNYGKEAAEDIQIMYLFPPEFTVLPKSTYAIAKQQPHTRYPEYNAAIFRMKLFHLAISKPFTVLAKMPDKTGKYVIPISIRARKIGRSDHKVTVQITS